MSNPFTCLLDLNDRAFPATSNEIRAWSSGEIFTPNLFDERTGQPSPGGLYCPRIFGASRDWECHCGRLRGRLRVGTRCEECETVVSRQRTPTTRLGHIELAEPVVHPEFSCGKSGLLKTLLGLSARQLDRVVTCRSFVAFDLQHPGCELEIVEDPDDSAPHDRTSESRVFVTGANAVRLLLQQLDLSQLILGLRRVLRDAPAPRTPLEIKRTERLIQRIQIAEDVRDSGLRTDDLVLDVLPVLAPAARSENTSQDPCLESRGVTALYARVLSANVDLRRIVTAAEGNDHLRRQAYRALQEAVDTLYFTIRPLVSHRLDAALLNSAARIFATSSACATEAAGPYSRPVVRRSPANGRLIEQFTGDVVLGCHYLTIARPSRSESRMVFASFDEARLAFDLGRVSLQDPVWTPVPRPAIQADFELSATKARGRVETTVGRILFSEVLPPEFPFYNLTLKSRDLVGIVEKAVRDLGPAEAANVFDRIQQLGLWSATRSGLSCGRCDLVIPPEKAAILAQADKDLARIHRQYARGMITGTERECHSWDLWRNAREAVTTAMFSAYQAERVDDPTPLNPVWLSVVSGAAGSRDTLCLLSGMPRMETKPNGSIKVVPTQSNFREGLPVLDYFRHANRTRYARLDTDGKDRAGRRLTKRLLRAVGDVFITLPDCGSDGSIRCTGFTCFEGQIASLAPAITGRVNSHAFDFPQPGDRLVSAGELISESKAQRLAELGLDALQVRSPLTCWAERGLCQACYGADPSTGELVQIGTPVGIHAALSLGESIPLLREVLHVFGGYSIGASGNRIVRPATGGWRRLLHLLEARRPAEPAVLAQASGTVIIRDRDSLRRSTIIVIRGEFRDEHYHVVPFSQNVEVWLGDSVQAGDRLSSGTIDPADVLHILGREAAARWLLDALRTDFLAEHLSISDKHFELIIARMLSFVEVAKSGDSLIEPGHPLAMSRQRVINARLERFVKVRDAGDSDFREGDLVEPFTIDTVNDQLRLLGGRPVTSEPSRPLIGTPILVGLSHLAERSTNPVA